jgi:hypothetical protein
LVHQSHILNFQYIFQNKQRKTFLPEGLPWRTVPRVMPKAHPLASVNFSIATDTATLSPFSTCALHAITPGTYICQYTCIKVSERKMERFISSNKYQKVTAIFGWLTVIQNKNKQYEILILLFYHTPVNMYMFIYLGERQMYWYQAPARLDLSNGQ